MLRDGIRSRHTRDASVQSVAATTHFQLKKIVRAVKMENNQIDFIMQLMPFLLIITIAVCAWYFSSPKPGENKFGPPPAPNNFPQALTAAIQKTFQYRGRASRSEYWYFVLFIFIFMIVTKIDEEASILPKSNMKEVIYALLGVVIFIQQISLTVRRLHDTNRTAWWIFLPFTIVGYPILIGFLASRGTQDFEISLNSGMGDAALPEATHEVITQQKT